MVAEWDANKKKPNPYAEPVAGTSTAEVRLELANEEAADARRGNQTVHDISASRWLAMGLDLEEQQYVPATHVIFYRTYSLPS